MTFKYTNRDYEGEVNGEGVVHETFGTWRRVTRCNRNVTDLFFMVPETSAVTCLTCLVAAPDPHGR